MLLFPSGPRIRSSAAAVMALPSGGATSDLGRSPPLHPLDTRQKKTKWSANEIKVSGPGVFRTLVYGPPDKRESTCRRSYLASASSFPFGYTLSQCDNCSDADLDEVRVCDNGGIVSNNLPQSEQCRTMGLYLVQPILGFLLPLCAGTYATRKSRRKIWR